MKLPEVFWGKFLWGHSGKFHLLDERTGQEVLSFFIKQKKIYTSQDKSEFQSKIRALGEKSLKWIYAPESFQEDLFIELDISEVYAPKSLKFEDFSLLTGKSLSEGEFLSLYQFVKDGIINQEDKEVLIEKGYLREGV